MDAARPTEKKVVKVNVFESDMATITAFLEQARTDKTEEAIHYAFNLMRTMLDEILEARRNKTYVEAKVENWKQAQLRSKLPFYG